MTCPEDLAHDGPLKWSPGTGREVWTVLHAAAHGDTATVRALVEGRPLLAQCHYRYVTPLYLAVRGNHVETARFLFTHNPRPFATWVAEPPLDFCAHRGLAEMRALVAEQMATQYHVAEGGEQMAEAIRARDAARVDALLDAHPGWVHAGDGRGNRPIHWAVMTRQPAVIDLLLACGASINARRADGACPIHLSNGDYTYRGWRDVPDDAPATPREVLDHLIARGAEVDIYTAAHRGDIDTVRRWLDGEPALANTNSPYQSYYLGCGSAMKNAAARGHLEIVQLLLERGADPNLREEFIAPAGNALYSAVYHGRYEVARLLLEHGASACAEVESSADALSIALGNEDERMVELLCEYGAARPVHLLAYYNDVQTAAAVFHADPQRADSLEALECAAGRGHESFVRLMLRFAPDLPARLSTGDIATVAMAELLFAHGLDANRADWLGVPPLHRVAAKGNVEVAGAFLARGAALEARDEDLQSTPLGWAARAGREQMVEFLLAQGARREGEPPWTSPVAWARARGHDGIAARLAAID